MKRLLTSLFFTALAFCSGANASASIAVVGSLSRSAKVEPGVTFDGVILLKNTDKVAGEARVFRTDYLFQADGSNTYGEPGSHARSNANWITVNAARVKLAPGETVPVRYKGKAPSDPSLRGSYWSMIMIEPMSGANELPSSDKDKVTVGLKTKIRMGVQIVTEVGRGAASKLQIDSKAVDKCDGKRSFFLDLNNTGERMLIPAVTVELFDRSGASIGRFEGGRVRIYPTCSARSRIDLTDVPPGRYNAMVLLDAGGDQVMGAQYDLQLDP